MPLALKEPLKQELDRLSKIGIIQSVTTPTKWISALVVTTKKNGKVRLCIDPKPLNQVLHRNNYPLPTIDDVLPLLSKARIFTVLDTKNEFWHMQLDELSSHVTTFGTPRERYRWLRVPFKLSTAPEEFQRRIDVALEGLLGEKAVADDILVFGRGDTDEEAFEDHDCNLCQENFKFFWHFSVIGIEGYASCKSTDAICNSDPCGMPQVMLCKPDGTLFNETKCFLLVR